MGQGPTSQTAALEGDRAPRACAAAGAGSAPQAGGPWQPGLTAGFVLGMLKVAPRAGDSSHRVAALVVPWMEGASRSVRERPGSPD